MRKNTKKTVTMKLQEVLDPEIGISIVDLGLIYKITVVKSKLKITMTLTTAGCPLIAMIEQDIRNKMQELGFKDADIIIDVTFDPPWSMDMISPKGKAMMGI